MKLAEVIILNLNALRYFLAVCNYGSVSAAAQFLHISQPSVSNVIKDLEREFGVMLFQRRHRGMALTGEGEQLYSMCAKLLEDFDKIERTMHELGNKRKTLRLGVPPMIGAVMLPRILAEFPTQFADIKLDICEGGRYELVNHLHEEKIDVAILPHGTTDDTSLNLVKISTFEIVFCIHKNHPLSSATHISPSDLIQIPLVLFDDDFYQTEIIKRWFADKSVKPDILMQTRQLSTLRTMVESGVAAGFLIKELASESSDIAYISIGKELEIMVSLARKKDSHMSDSMKSFIEYMIK